MGGTRFVGRAIVEQALADGHEISLFHRGQSGPELFPNAEHLIGDRLADLSALQAGQGWDAVIDVSAYIPRAVDALAEALKGRFPRMVFISTISVYADPNQTGAGAPLYDVPAREVETVTAETYGGLKVGCEQAVHAHWGENAWIVRPGLVAGPHDPTDRFTYWVDRVARCEAFVGPSNLAQSLQVVDVRDLATLVIRGLESGQSGVVNGVGPKASFESWFETIAETLGVPPANVLPTPDDVTLPLVTGEEDALFRIDSTPAETIGMPKPNPERLIRDTWRWWSAQDRPLKTLAEGLPDRLRPAPAATPGD